MPSEYEKSSSQSQPVAADSTESSRDDLNIMNIIRRTVAAEVGIEEGELDGTLDLSDVGLDSLLALTILGKLRDEVDIELPPTILFECRTLDALEAALDLKPEIQASLHEYGLPYAIDRKQAIVPLASSVLLQGNSRTASKTLFLFPDGSGSATSYVPLARVSPDIAVIGLNCPYISNPEDMKCSIGDITPFYLEEIRRRQPHGPYYFGGWSAGGICALDAAQELGRVGETVERLILIDSPNPIGLEKLPPRLYAFFESIGLFREGDKPPPKWLLPHFLAFVDSLDKHKPTPYSPGQAPYTHIVWARDGVCKFPHSPKPEWNAENSREMEWLLNNRTDFGPNGWERLLDPNKLVIKILDNANHFTMMAGAKAQELAAFIREAMS